MSDIKWERIAAHIETVQDLDYVNTVKAWLDQYQDGDLILGEARRQWKEAHSSWYQMLLEVCMSGGGTKLPKSPYDTKKGSKGDKENQPTEKNPSVLDGGIN